MQMGTLASTRTGTVPESTRQLRTGNAVVMRCGVETRSRRFALYRQEYLSETSEDSSEISEESSGISEESSDISETSSDVSEKPPDSSETFYYEPPPPPNFFRLQDFISELFPTPSSITHQTRNSLKFFEIPLMFTRGTVFSCFV